ncbi:hypothetical protein QYE76_051336 [Lolium multiflorum]|uniref:Uncharacterized protein n=1 Tax=Lolium multiflorum TaxID=4521 RepID=A0AAD8SRQ0_LOLMU|nr:hypothetical protein QYE76_051336 [Lolium multiflorum]
MSREVLTQMVGLTSSAGVWASMMEMFSSQSKACVVQLRTQLNKCRKEDKTDAVYFNQIMNLADEMATAGKPLDNEDVISYVLVGLDDEPYNGFVAAITALIKADKYISQGDLYAQLISYEARLESESPTGDSSVNAATRGGCGGYRGGRGGYPDQRSYEQQPRSVARKDILPWLGMAVGQYDVDTNWYSGTRATDHITGERDKLHVRDRYNGSDQIHTASGADMASPINFNQFLEKEKLKSNGSNFTDWFRHVRIFLNGGNLQYVLDAPLGDPPAETETDEVKNVYATRKTRLGINRVLQSPPPSYKNFVMNYNMQNMNKEFPELFGMLKAAEIEIKKEHQVLMVNKTTSFKKQGKSKGKFKKGGKKAATPPMKPKNGPKPDAECYYARRRDTGSVIAPSWASSKQCTVKSTESEYIAASGFIEAVWMKRFIVELGVVPSALDPLVIYCDNMGAIANAQEPRSHKRLKHIKLRYHSIREYIEDGEVKICKVHTDLNVADPLTKALPRAKHDQHQNAMGVRYLTM